MESDSDNPILGPVELSDERWYRALRARLSPIPVPQTLRTRITAMLAEERSLLPPS